MIKNSKIISLFSILSLSVFVLVGLFLPSALIVDKATFTEIDDLGLGTLYYDNQAIDLNAQINASDELWVNIVVEGKSLAERFSDESGYRSLVDYANSQKGISIIKDLTEKQETVIEEMNEKKYCTEVKYTYTTLQNSIGAKVKFGDIAKIKNLPYVTDVTLASYYSIPKTKVELTDIMQNTGILNNNTEYTGEGMSIAVIDSGLQYDHNAFKENPEVISITKDHIANVFSSLYPNEVNNHFGFEKFNADSVYKSDKVPFAFDYADNDDNVVPSNAHILYGNGSHGTHVSGIAAGKDEVIKGSASDAQIVAMKVFSDYANGASTLDIMKALSDAVMLGVDAINMSLGSPAGFSYEKHEDYDFINQIYNLIDGIGITIVVSAGNDANAGAAGAAGMSSSSNPDNGVVGAAASYDATLAAASVNSTFGYYFTVEGKKVGFYKSVNLESLSYEFIEKMLGASVEKKYQYVVVPGVGTLADYDRIDVTGKIAIVKRGDISFEEKQANAAKKGAVACIISNTDDQQIHAQMGTQAIPTCTISNTNGLMLSKAENKEIVFSNKNIYFETSNFSSIGVLPNLTLSPDLAAPGGQIYSSIAGADLSQYEAYSGTSMSAPNLVGVLVSLRQYVKEKYPEFTNNQIQDMVYQIAMSTAIIVADADDVPETPRAQGAGVVNIVNAINTKAYLSVNGTDRVKLSLGDDPEKAGIYTLKFNVNNISNEELHYNLDTIAMSETVNEAGKILQKAHVFENAAKDYSVKNGTIVDGVLTVAANQTARVTVVVVLDEEAKEYMDANFENGIYVEGFVKLTSNDIDGVDLSIPWVAFYGSWLDAPVFDSTIYDYKDPEVFDSFVVGKIYSGGEAYALPLGGYELFVLPEGFEKPKATLDKIALSYEANNELLSVYLGLLRSVIDLTYTISDKYTEQIYFEGTAFNNGKTCTDGENLFYTSHILDLYVPDYLWANNQSLMITIAGVLDYPGAEAEYISFPLTMDFEAPTVYGLNAYVENDRVFVDIDVFDNQYLMSYSLITYNGGQYLAAYNYALPIYDFVKGENNKVKIDLTDYLDLFYNNVYGIAISDYALNETTLLVNMPSDVLEFINSRKTKEVRKLSASLTSTVTTNNVEPFEIVNGELISYNGNEETVIVPSGVTSIGSDAFKNNKKIKKVVLPEGLTDIKSSAFIYCSSLEEVVVPNTLTTIGDYAFYLDRNLRVINLENTLVSAIGEEAFYCCTSLLELILPATDLQLGLQAFENCSALETLIVYANIAKSNNSFVGLNSLTTLEFHGKINGFEKYEFTNCDQLEVIKFYGPVDNLGKLTLEILGNYEYLDGSSSFSYMKNLKEVYFYDTVNNIDGFSFNTCPNLEKIVFAKAVNNIGQCVSANSPKLISYSLTPENTEMILDEYGVMYNKEKTKIYVPSSWDYAGTYVLPDTVTSLESSCLGHSELYLKEIQISYKIDGEEVTPRISIRKETLNQDKPLLTGVVLNNHISDIPNNAFFGFVNLSSFDFKTPITSIGKGAFRTTAIESIDLTSSLKTIKENAFLSCPKLVSISIPEETYVVNTASLFDSCTSLKEVKYPSSVKSLGYAAFYGCSSLEKVIAEGVTYVDEVAFIDCVSLVNLTLGKVDTVSDEAFKNCSSLVSFDFSNITRIGNSAFENCASLKEVILPNGLSEISDNAFKNCTSLEKIEFPDTLGECALTNIYPGCTSLKEIIFKNNPNFIVEDYAVYNSDKTILITYPSGNESTEFKAADECLVISANAFENSQHLLKVDLNNVLIVLANAFTQSVINEVSGLNVVEVWKQAFALNEHLKTINLPNVTQIDDEAFAATGLTEATIPASLEYIGSSAFGYCPLLTKVIIEDTLVNFDYSQVFNGTFGIKEILVSEENLFYTIENGMLLSKNKTVVYQGLEEVNTKEVIIPEGVLKIAPSAFFGLMAIEKVVFPGSLKAIGDKAFYKCDALKELVFHSEKAPILEGYYFDQVDFYYANFVEYIEYLQSELTIYHPEDSSYNTFIWENYFTNIFIIDNTGNPVKVRSAGERVEDMINELNIAKINEKDASYIQMIREKYESLASIQKVKVVSIEKLIEAENSLTSVNNNYLNTTIFTFVSLVSICLLFIFKKRIKVN